MIDSERNFRICAAEKLFLVKVLFEEVLLKASFEGTQGIKGCDGERKEEKSRFLLQRSKRHDHWVVLRAAFKDALHRDVSDEDNPYYTLLWLWKLFCALYKLTLHASLSLKGNPVWTIYRCTLVNEWTSYPLKQIAPDQPQNIKTNIHPVVATEAGKNYSVPTAYFPLIHYLLLEGQQPLFCIPCSRSLFSEHVLLYWSGLIGVTDGFFKGNSLWMWSRCISLDYIFDFLQWNSSLIEK